jgi:hypothetical protein
VQGSGCARAVPAVMQNVATSKKSKRDKKLTKDLLIILTPELSIER